MLFTVHTATKRPGDVCPLRALANEESALPTQLFLCARSSRGRSTAKLPGRDEIFDVAFALASHHRAIRELGTFCRRTLRFSGLYSCKCTAFTATKSGLWKRLHYISLEGVKLCGLAYASDKPNYTPMGFLTALLFNLTCSKSPGNTRNLELSMRLQLKWETKKTVNIHQACFGMP